MNFVFFSLPSKKPMPNCFFEKKSYKSGSKEKTGLLGLIDVHAVLVNVHEPSWNGIHTKSKIKELNKTLTAVIMIFSDFKFGLTD